MTLISHKLVLTGAAVALFFPLACGAAFPQSREDAERPREKPQIAPATQVYVGRVTRISLKDTPPAQTFMIYDDTHHANFFLSDPEAAARFEGEQARVVGTLDDGDQTIQVRHIYLYNGVRYASVGK